VYVAFMMVTSRVIASRVRRETGASGDPRSLMVAPVPLNPFVREVLIVQNGIYRRGLTSLLGKNIDWNETIPINRDDPAAKVAVADPELASFLNWSRFPFFVVRKDGEMTTVRISDARYSNVTGGGWASVSIGVPTPAR
jgi:inner membrane protein